MRLKPFHELFSLGKILARLNAMHAVMDCKHDNWDNFSVQPMETTGNGSKTFEWPGWTRAMVKVQAFRARKKLKKQLENAGYK